MAQAVPNALTRNEALRFLGKMGVYTYLTLAYPFATRHFLNASTHFRQHNVNVPGIYFNSVVDQVINTVAYEVDDLARSSSLAFVRSLILK